MLSTEEKIFGGNRGMEYWLGSAWIYVFNFFFSWRWPGIICPDPVNGQHVTHDLDGYVDSNHVEYLGDPHSRGWVAVKHISRYSTSVKVGTVIC